MNRTALCCLLIAVVWLCAPMPVAGQPMPGPDDVQVVRAVGYASIYSDDLVRARDEALADARVRALESLGFFLEGGASLSRGRLLDRSIQERTAGHITAQRVVREGRSSDIPGAYEVEAEVWVRLTLSPEERRRYKRKFSVVLDIPHEALGEGASAGKPMRRNSVENALRDALIQDGFEVYDRQQLSRIRQLDSLLDRARAKDREAVRTVTDYAMAEVVVVGKVEVEFSSKGPETVLPTGERVRGHFYRAYPNVFAMEGETALQIAAYSDDEGIKGYQLSHRKAAQAAANNAREPTVKAILERLRKYAGSDRITVTVAITGLPDVPKYRIYERLLKKLRWVESVEANDFKADGVSLYRVTYKEKFFFLLSQMYRLPGLDRVQGGTLRITADYTGLPQ